MAKAFASQGDMSEKNISFTEVGEGLYAFTAEGDPNSGVIIGDDFVIRDGRAVTDAAKRATQDRSVHGYKKMLKEQPEHARALADQIIKNTYRTLMTRGQKGCFVYASDPETREYFAAYAHSQAMAAELLDAPENAMTLDGLHLPIVTRDEAVQFERHVPVYDLSIAAGGFSEMQLADAEHWVELPNFMRVSPDLFVSRVVGESMNRRIPNGAWCLFRANPSGTRQGKVVVVQHRAIEDPDHGGSFTIKLYQSEDWNQVVNGMAKEDDEDDNPRPCGCGL